MKNRISKNFHMALNNPSIVKTAKSSLARGHMGGGRLGVPGVGTRDSRHVLGVHIPEKCFSGPRSKYTHSGHNTQRSFDPPPPPKWGTQVRGGTGVKIQKKIGGSFLFLNDDFTRG